MATFTRKKLAFLQLAATKGDIYDPAASTIGLAHQIVLHNTNTTAETVELFIHDGTNEYQILKKSIDADDTLIIDFNNEGLVIDANSKITGNTTTAAKVTCYICGSEETA